MKRFLVLPFLLALTAAPALAGNPVLSGHWVLVEDKSDDPREALKGLTLMRQSGDRDEGESGYRKSTTDRHYYAQQELLAKRRLENAVVDVGPIQQVLNAQVIDIDDAGASATVRYDSGYVRELRPTEGGPVYSAKGGEYKADSLGLELSYRRDGLLVIETMLEPRGRMLEEFKLDAAGRELTIKTMIDNPDWIIEARLKRVFTLNGTP